MRQPPLPTRPFLASTISRWSTITSSWCSRACRWKCPEGEIVALLGANGAGKSTTLKAISNLLGAERGEVTKGSVIFDGAEVHGLTPNELVRRGCIQVMEGRHCFAHLTVEENLLTGAFTRRDGSAAVGRDLDLVYSYFPRLKERRSSIAGYISGGEQQMCAIGRALMSRPKMILLDEPSMGLAPQLVEEIFEIVGNLNRKRRSLFPAGGAEYTSGSEICALRLRAGEWPGRAGWRRERARREPGRERILSRDRGGQAKIVSRRQALSAPQTLAGVDSPRPPSRTETERGKIEIVTNDAARILRRAGNSRCAGTRARIARCATAVAHQRKARAQDGRNTYAESILRR